MTMKHDVFEVEGKCVIPLLCRYTTFTDYYKKSLKYVTNGHEKIAKWEHIQMYENNPSNKGLKLIFFFTGNHCNKDKIPKMKVKYASQLFSQTVGKTMGYLVENGKLPEEARDSRFNNLLDNLFDSMNEVSKMQRPEVGKIYQGMLHQILCIKMYGRNQKEYSNQ